MSIRMKIILWFSVILAVIVALTYTVVFLVSSAVIQKSVQEDLIATIEGNVDEVEYYSDPEKIHIDNDNDQFIDYKGGYLEIDDDYLDMVNGVSTSLYYEDFTLLYGEDPIGRYTSGYPFTDQQVHKAEISGITYYIYDRQLTQKGLDGLWLRGVVSEEQGRLQTSSIVTFSLYGMPILLALALTGGYIIAGRALKPIRDMEDAAWSISRGADLKKRIRLKKGNDELHHLADIFNEMFARLDESFESERQFTSDVSHELRTPLSIILAQCEYTLGEPRSAGEYQEALGAVQRQGKRMKRMIDDMLSFMRMENSSESYPKEKLDYSAMVCQICADYSMIREKGITLSSEIDDGISVLGNEQLLTRLLSNLLSNAGRYGRENGHILVSLRQDGDEAVLSVQDDGVGIAPEDQKKIFKRFYQADRSRTGEGSGLGLSMVDQIARFHDGSVSVESRLGEGSTFTFRIKIAKEA